MKPQIHVWSLFIRTFHWVLVIAFAVSFISGESDFVDLHTISGYVIGVLLVARIIWGFISKGHAGFSNFIHKPRYILNYAKQLITGKASRHLGHNPLGGFMVLVLLVLLTLTVFSGIVLLGIDDYSGPLYFLAGLPLASSLAEIFEEIHELVSYLLLPAIALHVAGVIFSSLYHKENLIKSMISGKKDSDS